VTEDSCRGFVRGHFRVSLRGRVVLYKGEAQRRLLVLWRFAEDRVGYESDPGEKTDTSLGSIKGLVQVRKRGESLDVFSYERGFHRGREG
jgi:hypothetical protein